MTHALPSFPGRVPTRSDARFAESAPGEARGAARRGPSLGVVIDQWDCDRLWGTTYDAGNTVQRSIQWRCPIFEGWEHFRVKSAAPELVMVAKRESKVFVFREWR